MTDFLTNENQKYYNSNPRKQKEMDIFRSLNKKKPKIDKLDAKISDLKIKRCELDMEINKLTRERNGLCLNGYS